MTDPPSRPYAGRHARPEAEPPLAVPMAPPPPWEEPAPVAPVTPPVTPVTRWETPPGFVPLRPGRRSARLKLAVMVLAVVVALGAGAWFGLNAVRGHHSPAAATAVDADLPVVVHSAEGHFTAHFARQPTATQMSMTEQGVKLHMYLLADPLAHTGVDSVQITPGIPDSELPAFAAGVSNSVNHDGGAGMTPTTFLGHRAFETDVTDSSGDQLHELLIAYTSQRVYLLLAPAGAQFAAFENAFSPLP